MTRQRFSFNHQQIKPILKLNSTIHLHFYHHVTLFKLKNQKKEKLQCPTTFFDLKKKYTERKKKKFTHFIIQSYNFLK